MAAAISSQSMACTRLETVFNECFQQSENTRLLGGAAEPFYQPAEPEYDLHLLFYREDFFASALHEVAHWCIAGAQRRKQVDFGYWYAPEGRSNKQQKSFEAVEVKPQALEWYFSLACSYPFQISVDNFCDSGELPDTRCFRSSLAAQARQWQFDGLPVRALQFFESLSDEFKAGVDIDSLNFEAEALA